MDLALTRISPAKRLIDATFSGLADYAGDGDFWSPEIAAKLPVIV
jgi:hypothetical protein